VENDKLRLVYPNLRPSLRASDKWTQTRITVDRPPGIRDPTFQAIGIDGAIAGSRLNFVIADDLLNRENTSTPEQRAKTREFFDSSVLSRMDPVGTRVLVSNSPWHPEDMVAELSSEKLGGGWPTLKMDIYGGIWFFNADDEWDTDLVRPRYVHERGNVEHRLVAHDPDPEHRQVLWPARFPLEYIENTLRKQHLPSEFQRLYMCETRDDATAMCKREWVEACKRRARELGYFALRDGPLHPGRNMFFTGVDLAVSPGEESDDTSIFTFEVLPSGERLILDIDAGKYDGPTILGKLFEVQRRFDSILRVESNAAQDYIRQFALQKNKALPIKAHMTGRAKAHPEHGVPGLFLEMFNGAWLIPNNRRGEMHPAVDRFVRECLYYVPSKHTGDVLMSAYLAREQAKEFGVLSGAATAGMAGGVGANIMAR